MTGEDTVRRGALMSGVGSDAFAAVIAGALVALTSDPWAQGLWVGVLFFAVATASRRYRARRALSRERADGPVQNAGNESR